MPKKAISVTLEADNLVWLHGQAVAAKARGVSAMLDRLVSDARFVGRVHDRSVRSVAGTVEIASDDPGLDRADEHVRSLYEHSMRRPLVVRQVPAVGRRGGRKGARHG